MNGNWIPQSTRPFLTSPPAGTVGVVLPITENLKFFKLAFHSILDFTDHRYMLTVVDTVANPNSLPRQYVESIRRNHPINVLQFPNVHAQGAEWNLALRFMFAYVSVHYGVVLTPDVVVEPNWLSRIVRSLKRQADPTLVSPNSNMDSPNPEIIEALNPFCVAFRREEYETLKGFNDTLHDSEATVIDFGDRAKLAGIKLYCDPDVYVHHFARRSARIDTALLTKEAAINE